MSKVPSKHLTLSKIHCIHDTLWGHIFFDEKIRRIIDSPFFQRLRYVQQLSNVHYVFPTARHSRFEHSLGVYHLARESLNYIFRNSIEIIRKTLDIIKQTLEKYTHDSLNLLKELISLYGLLHDIAHFPFSHALEKVFWKNAVSIIRILFHKYGLSGIYEDFINFIYGLYQIYFSQFSKRRSMSDNLNIEMLEKELEKCHKPHEFILFLHLMYSPLQQHVKMFLKELCRKKHTCSKCKQCLPFGILLFLILNRKDIESIRHVEEYTTEYIRRLIEICNNCKKYLKKMEAKLSIPPNSIAGVFSSKNAIMNLVKRAEFALNSILSFAETLKKLPKEQLIKIISLFDVFHKLIDGKFDVDRLDYLSRDRYFAGIGAGGFVIDRLIKWLCIEEKKSPRLNLLKYFELSFLREKVRTFLEYAIFHSRRYMYSSVYYHHKAILMTIIQKKLFRYSLESPYARKYRLYATCFSFGLISNPHEELYYITDHYLMNLFHKAWIEMTRKYEKRKHMKRNYSEEYIRQLYIQKLLGDILFNHCKFFLSLFKCEYDFRRALLEYLSGKSVIPNELFRRCGKSVTYKKLRKVIADTLIKYDIYADKLKDLEMKIEKEVIPIIREIIGKSNTIDLTRIRIFIGTPGGKYEEEFFSPPFYAYILTSERQVLEEIRRKENRRKIARNLIRILMETLKEKEGENFSNLLNNLRRELKISL